MSKKPIPGPLNGRTILDCSILLPGPFTAKLLALKGARVIKVENPEKPDPVRDLGPFYDELNSCKEIVWLNLKKEEDQAKFAELVKKSDGLIEAFRPAAKVRLGLDAARLHSLNPKICVASIVGYPEDGPWRDRAGHDLNFQAVTGFLSVMKGMTGLPLADVMTCFEAAFSMSSMLDAAARGATGLKTSVSLSETLLKAQSLWIHEYRVTGELPKYGETLATGKFPCYGIYEAADGRKISVGAIEKKFWVTTCDVLGIPELAEHGYATGPKGKETRTRAEQAFRSKKWSEWAPLFDQADCCVEPVLDYSELEKK